jgi:AraC-like DNA-binding protein
MSNNADIKKTDATKRTFISLEHVLRFLAYGKNLGAPVESLLAFYNIDLRRDTPKAGYVPGHIWEMIIVVGIQWCKRNDDHLSGMEAAISLGNSFLGLWSFIAEKSDTLGKAIDVAVTYKKLHADTLDVVVQHQPGYLDIIITPSFKNAEAYAHASDFYLIQLDKFVKYSTGEARGVTESIHFQHAAPETPALFERYRAVFNCPIHFNAAENILRIHASALNLPLVSADAALQSALEPRAKEQLAAFEFKNEEDIEVLAQRHLRTLIATGRASKEALAEKLDMNPRALLRKLQLAGTTYRTLSHEVRLQMAQDYLTQPAFSLASIANHLGFQDPQSFSRWFTDQTGETPSTYRSRHESLSNLDNGSSS